MKSRDFCFWLQGWFELNGTIDPREGATPETLQVIQNHLKLVFKHEIDPSMPDPNGELQAVHDGKAQNPMFGLQDPMKPVMRC